MFVLLCIRIQFKSCSKCIDEDRRKHDEWESANIFPVVLVAVILYLSGVDFRFSLIDSTNGIVLDGHLMSDSSSSILQVHSEDLKCPFNCEHVIVTPSGKNASIGPLRSMQNACLFLSSVKMKYQFVYSDCCEEIDSLEESLSNPVTLSFHSFCLLSFDD